MLHTSIFKNKLASFTIILLYIRGYPVPVPVGKTQKNIRISIFNIFRCCIVCAGGLGWSRYHYAEPEP